MVRAGVFIGVDQSGSLQKLNDAAKGAERMRDWAMEQWKVDKQSAILITDDNGPVQPDQIFKAIKGLVDGAGAEQLVVYFAGHGVNINRGEQWLLTDAPDNPNAAVNVAGSVELARYCGVPHVVFFSDACRVAPEGIQAGNVRGSDIFPNTQGDGSNPVDQYFACGLGKLAAEIKDPKVAASNFSALYTDALLDALYGKAPEAFRAEPPTDPQWRYVGTASLRDHLAKEVPRRLVAKGLAGKFNQYPDAFVIDSGKWLSQIPRTAMPLGAPPPTTRAPDSVDEIFERTLTEAQSPVVVPPPMLGASWVNSTIAETPHATLAGAARLHMDALTGAAKAMEVNFGPAHFESNCGIKVRGARVVDVYVNGPQSEILDSDLVRVWNVADRTARSVLLRFDNGACAVVPVIGGYLAGLTFEDGELINIAYEPSENHWAWNEFQRDMGKLRRLRAVVATASQNGFFKLQGDTASKLAQQLQQSKALDPTLAIYAAYAYHDIQKRSVIREMSNYLNERNGIRLFDVELLGRQLVGKALSPVDGVVPFFPMLSQGWALLTANRFKMYPSLSGIGARMKNSLWTIFDDNTFDLLKQAMSTGELL